MFQNAFTFFLSEIPGPVLINIEKLHKSHFLCYLMLNDI